LETVGVTPVTPFSVDLTRVDRGGLVSNLRFLVEAGATVLYPAGNTGEVMSLAPEEWTTVVEAALEAADGRAAVVPGVCHELPVAVGLAQRARTLGVDGLLLMPRVQPYADSSGIVEYWRRVADAGGLPVVAYRRGLPRDDDLVDFVTDELVVGCKYAGRDVAEFTTTVATAADRRADLVWTCGLAERYAPAYWAAGARGFTSGLANFAPRVSLELYGALAQGAASRVEELRRACVPFEELRARHGDAFNVPAVKRAMDAMGLAGGAVRPPLRDLDEPGRDDAARLANQLVD
jgi:4-hydroxy-tetrahydrodipicolinate synthase